MPRFFSGLGVHRWIIFAALSLILLIAGDTTARVIGAGLFALFVVPMVVHFWRRRAQ